MAEKENTSPYCGKYNTNNQALDRVIPYKQVVSNILESNQSENSTTTKSGGKIDGIPIRGIR